MGAKPFLDDVTFEPLIGDRLEALRSLRILARANSFDCIASLIASHLDRHQPDFSDGPPDLLVGEIPRHHDERFLPRSLHPDISGWRCSGSGKAYRLAFGLRAATSASVRVWRLDLRAIRVPSDVSPANEEATNPG